MRRRAIVIGLGLVVFLVGIISIRLSVFSGEDFVEHKETLVTYEGGNITGTAIYFPRKGRCGINIFGSF